MKDICRSVIFLNSCNKTQLCKCWVFGVCKKKIKVMFCTAICFILLSLCLSNQNHYLSDLLLYTLNTGLFSHLKYLVYCFCQSHWRIDIPHLLWLMNSPSPFFNFGIYCCEIYSGNFFHLFFSHILPCQPGSYHMVQNSPWSYPKNP